MKKIIIFMILILLSVKVSAQEEVEVNLEWIPNVYYNYEKNGINYWGQFAYIRINDKIAYCLEINEKINTTIYTKSDEKQENNLVILAGYFGYGYNENNSLKDYMATQKLIWKYLGIDTYFTTKSDGEGYTIDVDENERKIISNINRYGYFPSYDSDFKFYVGSINILKQSNSFIGQLNIINETPNIITFDQNMLQFIANESGNNTFFLEKVFNKNFDNDIYIANNSQKIMTIGSVNNLIREYPYEITGGSLRIKVILDGKIDEQESSVDKNIFEIIDSNGTLIGTYIPDSEGNILIKDLPLGNYVIKHIKAPKGYEKETEEYVFEITEDCLEVEKEVSIGLKKINVTISKTYINPIVNILNYDEGVIYKVYNENEICVKEGMTNDLGLVVFELEYGNYKIIQSNVSFVEDKHNDITIDANMFEKDIFYNIHDEICEVGIKVFAIDEETNENIGSLKFKFNQEEKILTEPLPYIIENLKFGVYNFSEFYVEGYNELENFDYVINEDSNFYVDNEEVYVDLILYLQKEENILKEEEKIGDHSNNVTGEIENNDSTESDNNDKSNAFEEVNQDVIENSLTNNKQDKLPFLGDKNYEQNTKIFNFTNYIHRLSWMYKVRI